MENFDKVFVDAVAAVKRLTELSKTSSVARPSINDRLVLYGLYNQATKGDVGQKSFANIDQSVSEQKKYQHWLKYRGMDKMQARQEYVKVLMRILNEYSHPEVDPLRRKVAESWNTAQDQLQAHLQSTAPPFRVQSPAVSIYRKVSSSGVASSLMRPPSRTLSRSRQNSIFLDSEAVVDVSTTNPTANSVNQLEITRWQHDINTTLLKITTDLSNLKQDLAKSKSTPSSTPQSLYRSFMSWISGVPRPSNLHLFSAVSILAVLSFLRLLLSRYLASRPLHKQLFVSIHNRLSK